MPGGAGPPPFEVCGHLRPTLQTHANLFFTDAGPASSLFTWGLNNTAGRLGVGGIADGSSLKHVYTPIAVNLPVRELGLGGEDSRWELGEVECGQDALWATIVEDTEDEVD